MSRGRRLRVELETQPDGVRGVVHDEHGSSVPFWGWLDLIALVVPAGADDPSVEASTPTRVSGRGDGERT